mmetsp:Transcript_57620/g.159439  ORF Transcript_57620/g.159439 Transcript_57620/m.159439 type:complete len:287 (+) Transcript_57620:2-862(+)
MMCSENVYCSRFTFWPGGACYGFGRNATLKNGTAECSQKEADGKVTDGSCDGRLAVSGARQCGEAYVGLYPLPDLAASGAVGGEAPAIAPRKEGAGLPAEDVESWAPPLDASEAAAPSALDAAAPWVAVFGAGLVLAACVGGAAWGAGMFGETPRRPKRKRKAFLEEDCERQQGPAEYEALLPVGAQAPPQPRRGSPAMRPATPQGPGAVAYLPAAASQALAVRPLQAVQAFAAQPLQIVQARPMQYVAYYCSAPAAAPAPVQRLFSAPRVRADYLPVSQVPDRDG